MPQTVTVGDDLELKRDIGEIKRMPHTLLEKSQFDFQPRDNGGDLLTGAQFVSRYRIGREKLWQWVAEGKVEHIGEKGSRGQRFRFKREMRP
jgi:hypothetical protein